MNERCSSKCVTPALTVVKNNFRYSDHIKPFSLAADTPAAQGSQTKAQYLSKGETPSELDCERGKKKGRKAT